MRIKNFFIPFMRDVPSDIELPSHRLMLKSGMIRKLCSGVYTWLPLGQKIIEKVSKIIRDEMVRIGGQEISMPILQPKELWIESGRFNKYGKELLSVIDRNNKSFCFSPTCEELFVNLMKKDVNSHKHLPLLFFQIQNKFRDEIRPRFGVMRSIEFLMKDAYSYHKDDKSLSKMYKKIISAYKNIFDKIELDYRIVMADSGNIGGNISHEFHILSDFGEDRLALFSKDLLNASHIHQVKAKPYSKLPENNKMPLDLERENKKPKKIKYEDIYKLLEEDNYPKDYFENNLLNMFFVRGTNDLIVGLLINKKYIISNLKLENHPLIKKPLEFISNDEIREKLAIDCKSEFFGPIGIDNGIKILGDFYSTTGKYFICGGNENNKYYININKPEIAIFDRFDFREPQNDDFINNKKGLVKIKRSIEVGHIFQIGDIYSRTMGACIKNIADENINPYMGCYGIGVSRLIAAIIEQKNDEAGIIWPREITPFSIVIIPLFINKSENVKKYSNLLYKKLIKNNIDVLFYDKNESPGVMFNNIDLLGIENQIIISDRNLSKNLLEYKNRKSGNRYFFNRNIALRYIKNIINGS